LIGRRSLTFSEFVPVAAEPIKYAFAFRNAGSSLRAVFSGTPHDTDMRDAKRILLLEDDSTLLRMLKDYLAGEGHFVAATEDADEALRHIDREDWDLVITDGVLKTCCGEDFAAQASGRQSNLPFVLITGSARAVKDQTLFRGVLRKPFGREDFLRFITEALDTTAGKHAT
jgi:DNA-binding NtrC family response regulator